MERSKIPVFYEYLNLLNNSHYTQIFLKEVITFPEHVETLFNLQNENVAHQMSLLHVKTEISNLFKKKEFLTL